MAVPQHHLQLRYQSQQPQQQQLQTRNFRNFYSTDGQISPPIAGYIPANLPDQSQHPAFHVVGFAPGPVPVTDVSDVGADLQWNFGLEPKNKRLKEQDFLEINSQISSVDFLQARSVSTGLGLSLDNTCAATSGLSFCIPLIASCTFTCFACDYVRLGDRLRQAILDKVQASQLQTVSYVEEKILPKLHEKEAEVESINKKNLELEERIERVSMEASAWQQRARYNENMISALKFNLQQVYAQSRDSKEGCGDSEVDDTASCYNGRTLDFHLLSTENNDMKELMTCRVCRVKEVCMLLLPCKHLCLCKDCESKLSFCPVCQSSKYIGMEVYV
ncbi:BOI-related E3 ubiquitin-protein ligase 2 [Tripterygium wilfordii]|uniref:BOI-related E3 ubiquitin-protein ligase 2 n=1 Tax=Tripterygium wilfordii TaxID=458696 RepID=A0A7J7DL07_TRIWF|nr:BOI-related E3 ubiquitin-protein ligase 2 [Tripterygium wilfordii]